MIQILEQYTQLALTDANPEARQKGRRAFLSWYSQSPNAADNLYKILDYQVQKAIMDEKELANNSSSPNEMTVDTSSFSRSGTNMSSGALNNSYGGAESMPKKQKTVPNPS